MTTKVTDLEWDAAMDQIMAEQAVWIASCRVARYTNGVQRQREVNSRMQAIKSVGRYLDEYAVHSGALGG